MTEDGRERQRRAVERGRRIRGELLARLRERPQTARDLLPQIDAAEASLSEVAFQLGRLVDDDGTVVREQDGRYRLA